jgi:hypothetical protein
MPIQTQRSLVSPVSGERKLPTPIQLTRRGPTHESEPSSSNLYRQSLVSSVLLYRQCSCSESAGSPVIASAQNKPNTTLPPSALCHDAAPMPADGMTKPRWNGWGADSSQRRFQPAEMAHLTPSDVSKLKLKWAFELPAGRATVAQPTVMGGRIFIGTQAGKVYSLDANSGKSAEVYCAKHTSGSRARIQQACSAPPPRLIVNDQDDGPSICALQFAGPKYVESGWIPGVMDHDVYPHGSHSCRRKNVKATSGIAKTPN